VDVVIRPSTKAIGLDFQLLADDLEVLLTKVDQLAMSAA
jgi:RNase P protein component